MSKSVASVWHCCEYGCNAVAIIIETLIFATDPFAGWYYFIEVERFLISCIELSFIFPTSFYLYCWYFLLLFLAGRLLSVYGYL